jgi:hypothetical protein
MKYQIIFLIIYAMHLLHCKMPEKIELNKWEVTIKKAKKFVVEEKKEKMTLLEFFKHIPIFNKKEEKTVKSSLSNELAKTMEPQLSEKRIEMQPRAVGKKQRENKVEKVMPNTEEKTTETVNEQTEKTAAAAGTEMPEAAETRMPYAPEKQDEGTPLQIGQFLNPNDKKKKNRFSALFKPNLKSKIEKAAVEAVEANETSLLKHQVPTHILFEYFMIPSVRYLPIFFNIFKNYETQFMTSKTGLLTSDREDVYNLPLRRVISVEKVTVDNKIKQLQISPLNNVCVQKFMKIEFYSHYNDDVYTLQFPLKDVSKDNRRKFLYAISWKRIEDHKNFINDLMIFKIKGSDYIVNYIENYYLKEIELRNKIHLGLDITQENVKSLIKPPDDDIEKLFLQLKSSEQLDPKAELEMIAGKTYDELYTDIPVEEEAIDSDVQFRKGIIKIFIDLTTKGSYLYNNELKLALIQFNNLEFIKFNEIMSRSIKQSFLEFQSMFQIYRKEYMTVDEENEYSEAMEKIKLQAAPKVLRENDSKKKEDYYELHKKFEAMGIDIVSDILKRKANPKDENTENK